MPFSDLPLEVVSQIASLLPPPWYPTKDADDSPNAPPLEVLEALDPLPQPLRSAINDVSSLSKSNHLTLSAARPWLWENVDVKSGRGWLAIVNALTEEVIEIKEVTQKGLGISESGEASTSSVLAGMPVSPEQAHAQPMTIGNLSRYITPPSSSFYPSPYTSGVGPSDSNLSGLPPTPYSPPQPAQAGMLLTPPGSRTASPVAAPQPTLTSAAKLRGRSRSPRRALGLDSEGISSVLDRSRSLSLHRTASGRSSSGSYPKRIPLQRRRTSLSRSRTIHDVIDTDEEDEEDDEIAPLPERGRSRRPPTPPAEEEDDEDTPGNEDLLPPPGPYIRHLTFNNFRTIGSRRTQDEAVRGRFVTAGRLEGVIKNAPNLVSLCMTEYVDSSLSLPVLEELFFRGYRKPRGSLRRTSTSRGRSVSVDPYAVVVAPTTAASQIDPPRPTYVPYETETDEQKWRRRSLFTPLEALDLTGCVSSVFTEAMLEFWETWYAEQPEEEDRTRGRTRRRETHSSTEDSDEEVVTHLRPRAPVSRRIPRFHALKRLSLRACTSLQPHVIGDFVCSFPNLTHLDLSGTRVPSSLVSLLIDHPPRTLRLQSLSLARCVRLAPDLIVEFLVSSPCARDLIELNLYTTPTQNNSFGVNDITRLITAPCFKSGKLRYLDLSGADILAEHLKEFPAQPSLVSLGLSHIPTLRLEPIHDFLVEKASNVEILTLTGTAFESSLGPSVPPLQMTLELHSRLINPLTTSPWSLSSLSLDPYKIDLRPGPTRLRVIELSSSVRRGIADGASKEWRVVRSKGGRGWYVDLSAGWIGPKDPYHPAHGQDEVDREGDRPESGPRPAYVRHLPPSHPRRQWFTDLAAAGGRVGSAVGWHNRKMEVTRGMGMMGRDEGMAGAGGFAFEE